VPRRQDRADEAVAASGEAVIADSVDSALVKATLDTFTGAQNLKNQA
jgi:hypothetical protein